MSMKPGRCFASQVGVNAPGTENSTTVLPLKRSSVVSFCGPSAVIRVNDPSGILSPALMVIGASVQGFAVELPQLLYAGADVLRGLEAGKRLLGLGGVVQLDL